MYTKLIIAFTLLISTSSSQIAMAEEVSSGAEIVQRECSNCHSVGRAGDSPNPKSPPFREVVKKYPPEDLIEALGEGIGIAHSDMPEFIFEPEEIMEIIDYLNSLQ